MSDDKTIRFVVDDNVSANWKDGYKIIDWGPNSAMVIHDSTKRAYWTEQLVEDQRLRSRLSHKNHRQQWKSLLNWTAGEISASKVKNQPLFTNNDVSYYGWPVSKKWCTYKKDSNPKLAN